MGVSDLGNDSNEGGWGGEWKDFQPQGDVNYKEKYLALKQVYDAFTNPDTASVDGIYKLITEILEGRKRIKELESSAKDRYQAYKENPYYPFEDEVQWLNFTNNQCELVCKNIEEYDGAGKFGGESLQRIADAYLLSKQSSAKEFTAEDMNKSFLAGMNCQAKVPNCPSFPNWLTEYRKRGK